MKRASLLGLCFCWSWVACAGEGAERPEVKPLAAADYKKVITEYLADDEVGRKKLVASLIGADTLSGKADATKFAKSVISEAEKTLPKVKTKSTSLLTNLTGSKLQMNKSLGIGMAPVAEIDTPNGKMRVIIEGKGSSKKGALIYLHGGGNGGGHDGSQDNEMAWGWAEVRMVKYKSFPLHTAPRCIDDTATNSWVLESEVRAIETVVNALVRTQEVDPDQICLVGQSMGGFGMWNMGDILADRFAAMGSIGGGCNVDGFQNLRNVDIGVFIGANDGGRIEGARKGRDAMNALHEQDKDGYRCLYKEYPGVGHDYEKATTYTDVDTFFKGKKRSSYPKVVVWNPRAAWKKRFYNLGLESPAPGMQLRMEIADGNVVNVTSQNVPALTLYLNDSLVDLTKPVKVTWNGKDSFEGMLKLRAGVVLETVADTCDEGMYYTAKVELGGQSGN